MSGSGKGVERWAKYGQRVLGASPHSCETVPTTHRGHAEEYAAGSDAIHFSNHGRHSYLQTVTAVSSGATADDTSDDGGAVVLVGRQHAGTLRPGDVVETYSVGPASRATVVQIDRVTPSPLIRDVDRLVEGESGNIELAGPVADDYIQGQTLVPAS